MKGFSKRDCGRWWFATGGIGRGEAYVHTVTFGTSTPLSNLSSVTMTDNQAIGGAGGTGGVEGNGGDRLGGALLTTFGVQASLSKTSLLGNLAQGGAGAAGGRRQRTRRGHLWLYG